ncbi:nucleotide modification associated domain-containing protein [Lactobacillus delbrueckii]|uniref:nucleotide modification associated domain-containing protein n=1 Tax=Lactobacillus delbrueckii TaxID=1584 RepID=UPI001F32A7D1|nr:nucleotide modification associated domain-containing protein [Lactobacillus delbrueckii]GHN50808.1 phage protein [Lactobacillus delbrueckii]
METYKDYTNKLADTLTKKNAAYGDAFGKSVEKYGYIAALVRMSDKWNRLNTLMLNSDGVDNLGESVQDTLLDLAGYCILTIAELDNENKR